MTVEKEQVFYAIEDYSSCNPIKIYSTIEKAKMASLKQYIDYIKTYENSIEVRDIVDDLDNLCDYGCIDDYIEIRKVNFVD